MAILTYVGKSINPASYSGDSFPVKRWSSFLDAS
ncbi:hypothetical protein GGR25_000120 [Kaistia hirudinis]|uniref:Uncharacterized protein n=1 Tax=Kaistia hirudinis TaxID=1293440 RepID=A0A840AJJ1_9HYPH|nr:hypothetical protein [Kaistia hirudinis]